MSGDAHVRFCERPGVRFPWATHLVFFHPHKAHLVKIQEKVEMFVREKLHLTVHPNKIILRPFSQGVDFVGYVFLPRYRVLRTRTKKRMFAKMRRKVEEYNHGLSDERSLNQSLQSYLGILQHCSGFKVRQKLLHQVWLEKEEHFLYREEMK